MQHLSMAIQRGNVAAVLGLYVMHATMIDLCTPFYMYF